MLRKTTSAVLIIILIGISFAGIFKETPTATRAAFDLGSGKFKLLVADVRGKDVKVKYSNILPVELGSDFAESSDQMLSQRVQIVALEALKILKQEAQQQGASEFQGVATEIFRKAKNGRALLNRLVEETGIPLQVVSQKEEGVLGFQTAVALSPDIPEQEIISWDSGNASFQIVAKQEGGYHIYEGPLGNSVVAKAFIEEIRKKSYTQHASLQPMTLKECRAFIQILKSKITLPDWLKRKLLDSQTKVIGIGDRDSIFAVGARATRSNHFTIDQVDEAVEEMADQPTQELRSYVTASNPETVLTRLLLLYSVMDHFGIQEITFKESMGSTTGLLVDQARWK